MNAEERPDEIDVLRYLRGGAHDDATRKIEARMAGGDPVTVSAVEALRLVGAVIETDTQWGPSPDAMAAVRALVRERRPLPDESEWLSLATSQFAMGVRAVGDLDSTVSCEAEEFQLSVLPRFTPEGDRCAVDGQVVGPDGEPFSGIDVIFLVDEFGMQATCTDERGEFSFEEAAGTSFGLRLQGTTWTRFIRLAREPDA